MERLKNYLCLQEIYSGLCEELDLCDIYRILKPQSKKYTWRQKTPFVQSRLDYFIISCELIYNTTKCDVKPSIKSDHSLICLKLDLLNESKRGPGFWQFNNALLKDEIYIAVIREVIKGLTEQYSDIVDLGLKWDLIKADVRQYTIDYSRTQARIRREHEDELHKQFQEADHKLQQNYSNENIARLEQIKQNLEEVNALKTAGIFLRSKAQYIEDSEKCSAYFLNLEKRNYEMKHIKKLTLANDTELTDAKEILEEEKRFYKDLYSSDQTETPSDTTFFNDSIPKLSQNERDYCDQPISLKECAKALLSLKNGKSPGSDGFTPDFYKMFWKDISGIVFDSILYAQQKGELSIEQKRGVLKLIPKKDKNISHLKKLAPNKFIRYRL